MKAKLILIILFAFQGTLSAQRLSTGFYTGTSAFFQTRFTSNYLFPQHSYFTYITGNEDGEPIHNQKFNGLQLGGTLNVDYKRWMISLEGGFSFNTIRIPVLYPSPIGELMEDNWSTFEIEKSSFNLACIASFKLMTVANSPYLVGGLHYSSSSFHEVRFSLDGDISPALTFYLQDTEMYGVVYNEYNYLSAIGGIGYKKNNSYYTLRMQKRIGSENHPDARFVQVDIMYSRLLNFQKLKKGYHLYVE